MTHMPLHPKARDNAIRFVLMFVVLLLAGIALYSIDQGYPVSFVLTGLAQAGSIFLAIAAVGGLFIYRHALSAAVGRSAVARSRADRHARQQAERELRQALRDKQNAEALALSAQRERSQLYDALENELVALGYSEELRLGVSYALTAVRVELITTREAVQKVEVLESRQGQTAAAHRLELEVAQGRIEALTSERDTALYERDTALSGLEQVTSERDVALVRADELEAACNRHLATLREQTAQLAARKAKPSWSILSPLLTAIADGERRVTVLREMVRGVGFSVGRDYDAFVAFIELLSPAINRAASVGENEAETVPDTGESGESDSESGVTEGVDAGEDGVTVGLELVKAGGESHE